MGRTVTPRQERAGRRRLSRRARKRLSAALVVTLLLAAAGGWAYRSRSSQPGEAAPGFTLPASTGDLVRLEDYRGRQPVVLVFYMVGTLGMCTTQLVKLQRGLNELTSEGVAVFAVSIDTPEQARGMARQFGLTFPILSDPGMRVIRQYGMKGEGMEMADLGYAVIDRKGTLVAKRIDREFGNHVELLLDEVRRAKTEG